MAVKTFMDHVRRTVRVDFPPKRIISLCPSITETLYALNLADEIAGRTRYCIHPAEEVSGADVVGGTKQVDEEVIARLDPDLIIVEKEENPKEMVERLAERFPVYVTDVESYADALRMIEDVGRITNRSEVAHALVQEIERRFQGVKSLSGTRAAYVIWRKPYMAAGNSTFISSILERCGFINVFSDCPDRYPAVAEDDFVKAAPDVVFLSSEPFPFAEKHRQEFAEFLPSSRILLVDGEMFTWYGSHMVQATDYINQLLDQIRRL
ncbi:helical backbone metal receptor [Aneurinibacillus terranovensis]|uniref:helical backbone metal receptor n=1 Tax=Aneurinibacillus terranovensis TaxID=278991 RepID=UPI00040F101F|nr:helical backbone metal receptor [Aneurinibacillus terranovensis]